MTEEPPATTQPSNYPIVRDKSLSPLAKQSWRERRRNPISDPRPETADAHEVLVYRVDEQYVVDAASLGRRNDRIAQASHVSVVDLGRDHPVRVEFEIPSADEGERFTMRVTFACTVIDAVTVVRNGLKDAAEALRGYLRGHPKVFEMGLSYPVAAVNEVRRHVNAQLTAYATVRPPAFNGLSVGLPSIEVLDPETVARQKHEERVQTQQHKAAKQAEQHRHELEWLRKQNEIDLANHSRVGDIDALDFEHQIQTTRQRQEHLLEAERNEFRLREMSRARDLVVRDPQEALWMAYNAGKLDATQYAEQLAAGAEKQREIEQRQHDLAREDRLRVESWRRDDGRYKDDKERENARYEIDRDRDERVWQRENKREADRHARDAAVRDLEWEREEKRRLDQLARDDHRARLAAQVEVLRELARRGAADTLNLNIERLVDDVFGPHEVEGPSRQGLTAGGSEPDQPDQREDGDREAGADRERAHRPAEEPEHGEYADDDDVVRAEDVI